MPATLHTGYLPGTIGRVTELHAAYYNDVAGFGLPFESKVARELAAFCAQYRPGRDGLWLAMQAGRIEGSIAVDGAHADREGAHLRWFITSDAVRGTGVGSALLTTALDFCRDRQFERVFLWTFDGLAAARHLYEKSGFRLTHQQRGDQWGREVTEQRFEVRL